jgi:hypothetical protein
MSVPNFPISVRQNLSRTPRSRRFRSSLAHPGPFKDAFRLLSPTVVCQHLRRARIVIIEPNRQRRPLANSRRCFAMTSWNCIPASLRSRQDG